MIIVFVVDRLLSSHPICPLTSNTKIWRGCHPFRWLDQAQWWRAQAIRYMMRWPTPSLCHVTNKVRHESMGKLAAKRDASANLGQKRAIDSESKRVGEEDHNSVELNAIVNQSSHFEVDRSWKSGPYMPRPIVSIYVQQGDKAAEMRVFSLAAHMWFAERLRFHIPNLENVWLSTEMEVCCLYHPLRWKHFQNKYNGYAKKCVRVSTTF